MRKILQLKGLDCAACAAELEEKIKAIDGVSFASLTFVTQKLTVEYERDEVLEKVVFAANGFEDVRVVDDEKKETVDEKAKKQRL